MFTRVVEIRTTKGKAKDLTHLVSDKILPILKSQSGFLDEITLVSNSDPERILALSFWKSESDAEKYNRDQYPKVQQIISPFVDAPPKVQTFEVETSTVHNIAKGKAA